MVGAYYSIKITATLDINKFHAGHTGISAPILGFESICCCFQNFYIYTKDKKYFCSKAGNVFELPVSTEPFNLSLLTFV